MSRVHVLLAGLALWAAWPAAASAQIIINFSESGGNVVAVGSGSANTTGLGSSFGYGSGAGSLVQADSANVLLGATGFSSGRAYSGLTTTVTNFGTGSFFAASSGGGNFLGVDGTFLLLPSAYASGSALSATNTWTGQTFASMGLTPGTYTWTWGGGSLSTGQALQVIIPAAIPEPGPLALAAVVGVGALSARRFRRRK